MFIEDEYLQMDVPTIKRWPSGAYITVKESNVVRIQGSGRRGTLTYLRGNLIIPN